MGLIVQQVFQRFATGTVGLHEFADWAASEGLRTRMGGRMQRTSVADPLKNPVYCGDVRRGGVVAGACTILS